MEDTLKQGVEPNFLKQQVNRSSKIHRDFPQKNSAENETELSKPSTIPKKCGMVVLFQSMFLPGGWNHHQAPSPFFKPSCIFQYQTP